MVSVEGLMAREVVTAKGSESVAEVATRMAKASVGAVAIVEGEALVGVFSERDLLKRVIGEGRDPAEVDVGSVATREVVSVERSSALRACAETLKSHGVRHLPVVDGGRLVGMLSARDFFQAVTGELERFIEQSRYEEQLQGNVDPYDHLGGSYGR